MPELDAIFPELQHLSSRGMELFNLGHYQEAEPLLERAADLIATNIGTNNLFFATAINNLAATYMGHGLLDKAATLFPISASYFESEFGPEHIGLAQIYSNISIIHRLKGENNIALTFCLKALNIRENKLVADDPLLAQSVNNLAIIYHENKEYSKAEPLFNRTIRILRENHNSDPLDLASVLSCLGDLYRLTGRLDKALEYQEEALEIREKYLDELNPFIAHSCHNMASLLSDLKCYEMALIYQQKANEIREQVLDPGHPHLLEGQMNLELIKRALSEV